MYSVYAKILGYYIYLENISFILQSKYNIEVF